MGKLTPLKAIRAKCLDCSGDSWAEVEQCVIPECPLYPYRFGKRPATAERYLEARKTKRRDVGPLETG